MVAEEAMVAMQTSLGDLPRGRRRFQGVGFDFGNGAPVWLAPVTTTVVPVDAFAAWIVFATACAPAGASEGMDQWSDAGLAAELDGVGEPVADIELVCLDGVLVEAAGSRGDIEVELFNGEIWADRPAEVAARTAESYETAVRPHLT